MDNANSTPVQTSYSAEPTPTPIRDLPDQPPIHPSTLSPSTPAPSGFVNNSGKGKRLSDDEKMAVCNACLEFQQDWIDGRRKAEFWAAVSSRVGTIIGRQYSAYSCRRIMEIQVKCRQRFLKNLETVKDDVQTTALDHTLDQWIAVLERVELAKIASRAQSRKRHIDFDIDNEFHRQPTERRENTRRRDSPTKSRNESSNNTNLSNVDSERPRRRHGVESNDSDSDLRDAIILLTNTMSEHIVSKNQGKQQGKQELLSALENIERQLDYLAANMENNQRRLAGLEADSQRTNDLLERIASRLLDNTK